MKTRSVLPAASQTPFAPAGTLASPRIVPPATVSPSACYVGRRRFGLVVILLVTLTLSPGPRNVLLVATGAVALQITGPVLSGGRLAFSFGTISGQCYTVQRIDDLAGTNWILETNFTGTGALLQFATLIANAPRRFFRVREP
jgi:hypothetical protein